MSAEPQEERQPCLHCKEPTLGMSFPGDRHLWVCFRDACLDAVWEQFDALSKGQPEPKP